MCKLFHSRKINVLQPAFAKPNKKGLRWITEKIHHKNHITWIRKGDNIHSILCFLQSSVNSSQRGSGYLKTMENVHKKPFSYFHSELLECSGLQTTSHLNASQTVSRQACCKMSKEAQSRQTVRIGKSCRRTKRKEEEQHIRKWESA